jgi:hypothetical protein
VSSKQNRRPPSPWSTTRRRFSAPAAKPNPPGAPPHRQERPRPVKPARTPSSLPIVDFFLTARRRNPATVVIPGLSVDAHQTPGETLILFPSLLVKILLRSHGSPSDMIVYCHEFELKLHQGDVLLSLYIAFDICSLRSRPQFLLVVIGSRLQQPKRDCASLLPRRCRRPSPSLSVFANRPVVSSRCLSPYYPARLHPVPPPAHAIRLLRTPVCIAFVYL